MLDTGSLAFIDYASRIQYQVYRNQHPVSTMHLTPSTPISDILRFKPEALEAILALSPLFQELHNPLLPRVLASGTTVGQAAAIVGCSVEDFYHALGPLGYTIPVLDPYGEEKSAAHEPAPNSRPIWLDNNRALRYFDVRLLLEKGRETTGAVLQEIQTLAPDEVLCVITPFVPLPLIALLTRRGFHHWTDHRPDHSIYTYFFHSSELAAPAETPEAVATGLENFDALVGTYSDRLLTVDVRRLDSRQPMLAILENLEQLPSDHALFVHHEQVPVPLLCELEERGYEYDICEMGEDDVKLLIRRPDSV
jgi:uncharacterized protein (DUF2249 family)